MGAAVVLTSRFGKSEKKYQRQHCHQEKSYTSGVSEMDRESARSGPRTAGALPDVVTNWPHKEDGVMMAACRTSFTWTFSGRAEFVS